MKTLKIMLCAVACLAFATSSLAQISKYDYNQPVGWGLLGETQITGGNEENAVLVTTFDELKAALAGTDNKTIYIKGEIVFAGHLDVQDVKNKTLYGLPGSALVNPYHSESVDSTGILNMFRCENFIIRNLIFKGAGAYDIDGKDNLTLTTCKYIWVDHCDFQDGVDGNFDCNYGSDYVCVSWCRFHYLKAPYPGGSGGSDDHRLSDLWGSGDGRAKFDTGHLKTTFYSCWWGEGCKERMPRVRFGKVHLLNCLYTCTGNNYCIGTGYASNIYVEKCAFIDVNNPYMNYAMGEGHTDYNITVRDCIGQSDAQERSGSTEYFIPSDYYQLEGYDVNLVESEVKTHSGATLNIVFVGAGA